MAQPFFSDIFKDSNDLLNKDFFHATPLQFDVKTIAKNGVNFNVKAKQNISNGPLAAVVESKFFDKTNGLVLTQGWANNNNVNTKLEVLDITPGLKTELNTTFDPNELLSGKGKNVSLNVSFAQPYFNARGLFNLLNGPPNFVGDMTVSHNGFVCGSEIGYDISKGAISRYALSLAYKSLDYSVGVAVNNKQVTSLLFNQVISKSLQVGSRATLDPKVNSNKVNLEFVTKYLPDDNSQVKAKISDLGTLSLSYKQLLRPGVTLGVGSSFDALKLNEPVHKIGWSLSFNI
ncbi:porin POR1 KNAG_0I01830 [Huiozyma naganishii CBS 8797]|uniref:Mitochondrial outer membrane protein porin n=1 Tax=Huiozyma naganishii (strain ATCC MYA-139 / BCRC 22969 / CBS 8797 / KCTC 17520 / NBRC 10181 / NCYC 3082 / Yp74L-3) TaxID=1071383 RepID=J7RQC7_HUIN7|nr:hypothetical protein KNAG_0I01830 [Kazachstania naganishii CBS 8797]CCK71968.1 hypothetical protein KNAG_0I01830 [Kazachstania naganishii CBS 8797]